LFLDVFVAHVNDDNETLVQTLDIALDNDSTFYGTQGVADSDSDEEDTQFASFPVRKRK
jgi:hypothetical protein